MIHPLSNIKASRKFNLLKKLIANLKLKKFLKRQDLGLSHISRNHSKAKISISKVLSSTMVILKSNNRVHMFLLKGKISIRIMKKKMKMTTIAKDISRLNRFQMNDRIK